MSAFANELTCPSSCGCDELCPDHGNTVVIARHLVESGRYEALRAECRSRQGKPRPDRPPEAGKHSGEWSAVLAREDFGSRRGLGDALVRKLMELTLAERQRGPLLDASTRADATDPRAYPIAPAEVPAFAAAVRALVGGVRDGDATIAHAHRCALSLRETRLSSDDRRALTRARVETRIAEWEERHPAESARFSELTAVIEGLRVSGALNDLSDEQRSDLVDAVASLCVAMEPTAVEVMQVEAALRSALPPYVSLASTGTPPRGFPRAGNPVSPPSGEKAA